jgi:hypothetical protein
LSIFLLLGHTDQFVQQTEGTLFKVQISGQVVQHNRLGKFFEAKRSYQYTVMPFGLKNAPTIFSRVVIAAFKEFIHQFLEVYLDDWTVYSLLKDHVEVLRLMLERCRQCQISLNIKKCIFGTPFGILLGHIVCKQGLLVDPAKIAVIVNLPPPKVSAPVKRNTGTYMLLQEVYKGVCADYCTNGKIVKEGHQISVE